MPTSMKTRLARVVLRAVIAAAVVLPSPASAQQLMSIVGLETRAPELLHYFMIGTTNMTVLAVCHIPYGWGIKVDQDMGPFGELFGGAGHGAAGLRQENLDTLRRLFLVKDPSPDGPKRALVGEVGLRDFDTGEIRGIDLQPANYLFEAADSCP